MIPVLAWVDALPTFALAALVVIGAIFDAPGMAAQESRLPELGRLAGLSVKGVSSAKAVLSNSAILVGPALGGAAIGLLGAAPALFLTAFCSAAAGILAFLALPPRSKLKVSRIDKVGQGMGLGIRHLRREPLLGPLLLIVTLFAGIMSAISGVLVPALFVHVGRPALDFGVFASSLGAGGIVGAAGYGLAARRIAPKVALTAGLMSYAAAVLSLVLLPPTPVLVAVGVGAGVATGTVSPIFNAAIYERTPLALRGRVLGAISAVATSAAPLALILGGIGSDLLGPRRAIATAAPLAMLVAVLSLRLDFKARRGQAGCRGSPAGSSRP
jgi:macrolide resistance protein